MEEEKQEKKNWCEKTLEQLEKEIEKVNSEEINPDNITYLGKVIDAHKDLMNEYYWKEKIYMYRDYNDYNEGSFGRIGVPGTGRRYGRKGYDTKYRGEEMLDEMNYSYGVYSNGNEYGNYNGVSTKELEKMLDCNVALIEHLRKNAKSQEEIQIIDQKVQEMSRM